MNVGLPREIFINDKPERFALIALVYWEALSAMHASGTVSKITSFASRPSSSFLS